MLYSQKTQQRTASLLSRRGFLGMTSGIGASCYLGGLSEALANTPQASAPSDLKITDVDWAYMRGHGVHLLVRIHTNQGVVGMGEGIDAVRGSSGLMEWFRDQMIGENPLNVDRVWEKLRRRGIFHGAQAGMFVAALSGVDLALWDTTGKALGLPVYQLLGGKFRDKIRMYCDTGGARSERPEDLAQGAREKIDMGFTAVKFDLDNAADPDRWDTFNWTASNSEIDHMVAKVAATREAIGTKYDLMCDCHGRYDLHSAMRIAKQLEPYRLHFLEEPVPAESVDAMAEITHSTSTPICAGENLYLRYGFRDLLEQQAVDMIMPDIQKCGGLSEARKIANLAETYYIPFSPHNVVSPLGTMASCHVCASVPNFSVLEWHWAGRLEQWNALPTTDDATIRDGHITLTDKPGIGIDLDLDVVRKYAVEGWPVFGKI
jgi:galactonate dehydratase